MSGRLSAEDLPTGHPGWDFLLGATPFFAVEADPRFSYSLYVPRRYRALDRPLPLLVAVHGTGRSAERTRDSFRDFAESAGIAVLAPLFPGGIGDPNDLHNYKLIEYQGIRFDEVLLAMVDEAAERWQLDTSRMLLAGFSGGGQFVHRFTYLHPSRVRAASVGAPGRVTLLDDESWPHGVGDVASVFGSELDFDALGHVAAQIVVGADDDGSALLAAAAADPREARAGASRVERAGALAASLEAAGVPVTVTVVPGVAHSSEGVRDAVVEFLAAQL